MRAPAGYSRELAPLLTEMLTVLPQLLGCPDQFALRLGDSPRLLSVLNGHSASDQQPGGVQRMNVGAGESWLDGLLRCRVRGQLKVDIRLLCEGPARIAAEDHADHEDRQGPEQKVKRRVGVFDISDQAEEGQDSEPVCDRAGPNKPSGPCFLRCKRRAQERLSNLGLEFQSFPRLIDGGWGASTPQAEGVLLPSRPGVHAPFAPPPVRPAGTF